MSAELDPIKQTSAALRQAGPENLPAMIAAEGERTSKRFVREASANRLAEASRLTSSTIAPTRTQVSDTKV